MGRPSDGSDMSRRRLPALLSPLDQQIPQQIELLKNKIETRECGLANTVTLWQLAAASGESASTAKAPRRTPSDLLP
jgi:hypothetical protein